MSAKAAAAALLKNDTELAVFASAHDGRLIGGSGVIVAGYMGGRGKRRNMIASAELTAEQMFTLRDTIDEAIREKGWTR